MFMVWSDKKLEHLFYFCDRVQMCLDWLQDILSSRFLDVRFLDDEFIYSSFQYNNTNFLKAVLITTYMLKGHVWARRQATLYFDVICTDTGILKGFQYKLTERIKLDFFRLPRNFFTDIWLSMSYLVQIDNNTLKVADGGRLTLVGIYFRSKVMGGCITMGFRAFQDQDGFFPLDIITVTYRLNYI